MPKRFSLVEFGLLMIPVMAVSVLGWWMSKRPPTPNAARAAETLRLKFHIDNPTALEAFRGANVAFVVKSEGYNDKHYEFIQATPYLEVKTPHGKQVLWSVWNHTSYTYRTTRFLLDTRAVPSGTLHLGCQGVAQPTLAGTTARLKPLRASGKWKVDRSQINSLNLAAWPRHPLVSVREVVVTEKIAGNVRGGSPDMVTGEAVFELKGVAMNQQTSFEVSFSNQTRDARGVTYGMSYSTNSAKETLHRRVRKWTVSNSPRAKSKPARVSGRVSADNRWPLGFEIQPFDFQTVKIGQKLGFKQSPVPLPK